MSNLACMVRLEAPADPDRRIVEAVLSGQTGAYTQLVERYWDRIYQRVFQLLKNPEDAEEITQDAFTRAYVKLETFRWEASFATWLYQIASNLARNRFWYWQRRGRNRALSLETPMSEDGLRVMDAIADDQRNPADRLNWKELVDQIEGALPQLPELHREVMDMRLVQNMSYEAISDHLQIPVGTVKSRLARAREQLVALLKLPGNRVQRFAAIRGEEAGLVKRA